MLEVLRRKVASSARMAASRFATGSSQDSIFIAREPWMTSPASRTRSSVRAAVLERSQPMRRTSTACSWRMKRA